MMIILQCSKHSPRKSLKFSLFVLSWFGKDLFFFSLQVLGMLGVINLLTSTLSLWTNPDLELRVRLMPKQNPTLQRLA